MDLILWRHAEARRVREGQDDLERALTPKGERQAAAHGRVAQPAAGRQARACWSARRCAAQQTAQALGRKFKTVAALAPDASVDALLAAARWPDAGEPVLVVGHQPTLGLAAA